jgi:hypothetical protein
METAPTILEILCKQHKEGDKGWQCLGVEIVIFGSLRQNTSHNYTEQEENQHIR